MVYFERQRKRELFNAGDHAEPDQHARKEFTALHDAEALKKKRGKQND